MNCQYCESNKLRKKGKYMTQTGLIQRYQCKACLKTQSCRTGSESYRLRKRRLAKRIEELYCERMSLRGIARVLKISRSTVNTYFLRAAKRARTENLRALDKRKIVSTYVQFDALETFEHSKQKPLGVWLSVRAKTGQLISAKVFKTDIRALSVSKAVMEAWNRQSDKENALVECLLETRKAHNRVHTTVGCDGERGALKTARKVHMAPNVNVVELGQNKKIDLSIRKLRNDISRLSRKSLSSTKKAERLQNHLDLYINYHNRERISESA